METVTDLTTGHPIEIEPYDWTGINSKAPPGLGRLAYRDGEYQGTPFRVWYYQGPRGPWQQVTGFNPGADWRAVPPLPQPREHWAKCGCGKAHVCTQCGQPYYIEIHGVAAGYCTYCYHT